jgi:hypothetical protein
MVDMGRRLCVSRFLFLGAIVMTSGCSFLFTKKLPSEPDRLSVIAPIKCTSSQAAPIVDSAVGALQVVRTALAINADDSAYTESLISREADIGFGVTLAALFISSAAYGFVVTGDCRAWKSPPPRGADTPVLDTTGEDR